MISYNRLESYLPIWCFHLSHPGTRKSPYLMYRLPLNNALGLRNSTHHLSIGKYDNQFRVHKTILWEATLVLRCYQYIIWYRRILGLGMAVHYGIQIQLVYQISSGRYHYRTIVHKEHQKQLLYKFYWISLILKAMETFSGTTLPSLIAIPGKQHWSWFLLQPIQRLYHWWYNDNTIIGQLSIGIFLSASFAVCCLYQTSRFTG